MATLKLHQGVWTPLGTNLAELGQYQVTLNTKDGLTYFQPFVRQLTPTYTEAGTFYKENTTFIPIKYGLGLICSVTPITYPNETLYTPDVCTATSYSELTPIVVKLRVVRLKDVPSYYETHYIEETDIEQYMNAMNIDGNIALVSGGILTLALEEYYQNTYNGLPITIRPYTFNGGYTSISIPVAQIDDYYGVDYTIIPDQPIVSNYQDPYDYNIQPVQITATPEHCTDLGLEYKGPQNFIFKLNVHYTNDALDTDLISLDFSVDPYPYLFTLYGVRQWLYSCYATRQYRFQLLHPINGWYNETLYVNPTTDSRYTTILQNGLTCLRYNPAPSVIITGCRIGYFITTSKSSDMGCSWLSLVPNRLIDQSHCNNLNQWSIDSTLDFHPSYTAFTDSLSCRIITDSNIPPSCPRSPEELGSHFETFFDQTQLNNWAARWDTMVSYGVSVIPEQTDLLNWW